MENEIKRTRGFGIGLKDHPTTVSVAEISDGSMEITIRTERPGMEESFTSMRLVPKTLGLLSEALFRAAHDPDVWRSLEEDGGQKVD